MRQVLRAASFFALLFALVFAGTPPSGAESPPVAKDAFAGRWVDGQNNAIAMTVTRDNGVYRLTGGDESYGYELSCLFSSSRALCHGHGGLLEGKKFLYTSRFELSDDGRLTENWTAFNNLRTVSGTTVWRRP